MLAAIEHLCYASGLAALRDDAPRGQPPLLERTVRPAISLFGKHWRSTVTTGTIKKVIADRGFGFIAAEDAKEYFFHRGGLDSSLDFDRLSGGERVEFDIEESPKGPRANHVRSA
jgi:CspA family cold shock protein